MKVKVRNAQLKDLKSLAYCHMSAFPSSLTTAMGVRHVQKTLEWYIIEPDAMLIMAENDQEKTIGYAGGLLVHEKTVQGSTSAMSQYAFKTAIIAFCLRPWLLFHPQVRRHFPYIRYFLKRQWRKYFFGKKTSSESSKPQKSQFINRSMGLVGIGVLPEVQGMGVGTILLKAFEEFSRSVNADCMDLSVEPENENAIRSYIRNGWQRIEDTGQHCMMHKELSYES